MPVDYRAYPILYVDDEKPNLVALRYAFEDQFHLITASSGEEALRIVQENDVAVLLADQRMPGMSGVELCERVRAVRPDTVRMIITAYADLHAAIDAINRGGVTRYVPKPFRNDDLAEILRTAIELVHVRRTVGDMETRLLQQGQQHTASALSAEVVHEVNNYLTPLGSCLEDLSNLLTAADGAAARDVEHARRILQEAKETIGDATQALQQLHTLLERFRSGERRPRRGAERCDAARVVDSTARILRDEIERVARLEVVLEGSPQVPIEASALGQVTMNLILNAVQALSHAPGDGKCIRVRVARLAGEAAISVSDTGLGVEPEVADRIFDPFFTTKEGGSGLGLSVAHRLIEEAGGQLVLDNQPGRGATFTVKLPAQGSQPPGA